MPGSDVFTNGYQRSSEIQGNGTSNVTFEITTEIFGLCHLRHLEDEQGRRGPSQHIWLQASQVGTGWQLP